MATKKKRESIPLCRRPEWEVELEGDDCPYVANMAKEGLLAPFIYGIAAGVKEEDCWDYGIIWPSRLELGAMAMHPVVGPMLERAWLFSKRNELVLGLSIAAENGNRNAAEAISEWLSRGTMRLTGEGYSLSPGEFVFESHSKGF